jgi:hypothetical protein
MGRWGDGEMGRWGEGREGERGRGRGGEGREGEDLTIFDMRSKYIQQIPAL